MEPTISLMEENLAESLAHLAPTLVIVFHGSDVEIGGMDS